MATIAVIGTLDTKGELLVWLAGAIRERGHQTLLVDLGTGSPPIIQPDLSREAVLQAAGRHLERRSPRDACDASLAGKARQAPGTDARACR